MRRAAGLLSTAERIDDLLLSPEDALCIAQDVVAYEFRAVCARNRLTTDEGRRDTIARLVEGGATAETIASTVGIPVGDADTIVRFFKMESPGRPAGRTKTI